MMVDAPQRRSNTLRDEDLLVRGGSRSLLGRTLKSNAVWGDQSGVRNLKGKDIDELIKGMLEAAGGAYGFVAQEPTAFEDSMGWRLNEDVLLFKRANAVTTRANAYFQALYETLAKVLRQPALHFLDESEAGLRLCLLQEPECEVEFPMPALLSCRWLGPTCGCRRMR